MSKSMLYEWLDQHQRPIQVIAAPLIMVMVAGIYMLVNITGGIKFVYSHTMYIPILLAGLIFGIRGGMLAGFVAGVILGSFTPIDVLTGERQLTLNWLYRLGIFVLVGIFSGVAHDAALKYQTKLKWLLKHDHATCLPNRVALLEELAMLKIQPLKQCHLLAVICCENQIELKAAFGSEVIEQVVLQLAQRFRRIYPDVKIYHTETAQITLLLSIEHQKLNALLSVLQKKSHDPVVYNNLKIHIDSRMGYIVFNEFEYDAASYLRKAEAALVAAHAKSRELIAYCPTMRVATEENLQLLGELKHAIEAGQLTLHYQPKICMKTGRVYGAEALLRWEHPVHGLIAPNRFIAHAEQSTLIDLITEFVLMQSIKQLSIWKKAGFDLSISVNISSRNLLKPGFSDYVLQHLNQYDLCGDLLELEITEGSLIVDIQHTIEELNRLTSLKVVISIDDFGTGYSSLQYLHQLPISVLKMDQSFVLRLPNDQGACHIMEAAISLAHNLDMKAIAEGVESQEIYDYLNQINCDMVQGYHICKPLNVKDFDHWYKARHGQFPAPITSA